MRGADAKHRGWRVAVVFVCISLLAAGLLYFYYHIYQVAPVFSEMTCEYGDAVSQDITDYISGTDWSVQLGWLDFSQVDQGEPGTYEAVVHHGRTQFTYTITIQDTIAPQILWKDGLVCLPAGVECDVEDVIEGVSDVDYDADAVFLQEGEELSRIRFDRVGEYRVELLARDRAGNETKGEVAVIVDTPPVIEGIRDFYVIPGSEPDCLEEVTARDDLDGDLTRYIQVDDSKVHWNRVGRYALRYLSKDSYGLETVEEAQVMVGAPEKIQELIGHRQIDYREDVILGAPNIYDGGASSHEDVEEALGYMRPAFVQLYHGTGGGGFSAGSGYIMEITEDKIYICTNHHVIEKYEDWDIYFFDGTKIRGQRLGTSDVYDVGVAIVELENVPQELLDKLMTVHIDRTYWEGLDQQEITLALERVDKEGGLLHVTTGELIKIKQEFDWYDQQDHTEVTLELVRGDSGSAVLDGYGNLICMAYAYSTDPIRYWCIPLDGILDCYEEITGRAPYVY